MTQLPIPRASSNAAVQPAPMEVLIASPDPVMVAHWTFDVDAVCRSAQAGIVSLVVNERPMRPVEAEGFAPARFLPATGQENADARH